MAGPGNYTHADIHALEFVGPVLYCGSDGGIYKSTNNAADWVDISNGLELTQIYRIGLDPNNENKFVTGTQDNGSNRTENGNFYHFYGNDGAECIIDPTNTNVLYASKQAGGLVKSLDNGATLLDIKPLGAGGGQWVTPYVMDPSNNLTLYAGYADVWKTTNGGSSWTNISNGGILTATDKCLCLAVAPSNNQYIYASKYSGIYRTTNGGSTWSNVSGTAPNAIPTSQITDIAIHPTNPNIVWLTFEGFFTSNNVYRTNDGGANWSLVTSGLPPYLVNCIVYQEGSNNGVYIGTDYGVYYKDDNLASWISFSNGLPLTIVNELEIHYGSGRIRAGTFGRGMWESDLYGTCPTDYTFTSPQAGNLKFEASNFIASSSTLAGGSNVSYKAGGYVELNPGFTFTGAIKSKFEAQAKACGQTFRKGVKEITGTYAGPMPGLIEALPGENEATVESASAAISVYPNPANESATLNFTLVNPGKIYLSVYNSLGEEKMVLIKSTYYERGDYAMMLDVSGFSQGMYYVLLKTENRIVSSKVVVE